LLHAQGFTGAPASAPGPEDVLAAIRRMHALQIDTISVVARSPYLVLWSRIGDYEPALLDGLLASHDLFEYWSHAACFIDSADYPLYRRVQLDSHLRYADRRNQWFVQNAAFVDGLLAHVRAAGPVRSADFARPEGQKGGGWWDWKAEKLGLEMLNTRGDLMVTARQNFQRLYDLRERVMAGWDDSRAPSLDDALDGLMFRSVRALGVGRADWIVANLQTLKLTPAAVGKRLERLAAEGGLVRVDVEGWALPGFVHPDNAAALEAATRGDLALPGTALLSPFDPITWDRARALELFSFEYKIECYTPAPKRKYGYFTLPIVHRDALVGRLDPKAHRKQGVFEVKAIHLEPGVEVTADLAEGLRDTLRRLAAWHGTPEVVVGETNPRALRPALRL
jgi:uncharacterized protein YcaQ